MTIPSSITKFVEAHRKAMDGIKPAPFLNKDLVVARAAKLQELLMNPKNVASPTSFAPALPIDFFILSWVTKTWIMLLTMYPKAKAQSADQKKPTAVLADSPHFSKNPDIIVSIA